MARFQLSSILCCIASLFVITNAQAGCPNQLAFYNPNIRSSCVNGSESPTPNPLSLPFPFLLAHFFPLLQTTSSSILPPSPFPLYPLLSILPSTQNLTPPSLLHRPRRQDPRRKRSKTLQASQRPHKRPHFIPPGLSSGQTSRTGNIVPRQRHPYDAAAIARSALPRLDFGPIC